MSMNLDLIIATPGRFVHLVVEMRLDLSSVQYAVFDEADRLFEMGFAAQLTEILHALLETRQTMLFSATLPTSLVEFAQAVLREPQLIRLDPEHKVSADLENAFFTMKKHEKDGALLHILNDVIKIPTGATENAKRIKIGIGKTDNKRKRNAADDGKPSSILLSTLVFAQTKHHVEYLAAPLHQSGYSIAYIYSSLDQTARQIAVYKFRSGVIHVLIVTDVAARGIDFPVLANVVNYDFPSQPKIFVHKVGRTARAGQRGWSYSLVSESDVPYLMDLHLFLGKSLVLENRDHIDYATDLVLGGLVRDRLETHCEWVSKLVEQDSDLQGLRSVAVKGGKFQLKTRNSASSESVRRSNKLIHSDCWLNTHPLFDDVIDRNEVERERMLTRIRNFKPLEMVFEVGKNGPVGEAANVLKKQRATFAKRQAPNDLSIQKGASALGVEASKPDNTNANNIPKTRTLSKIELDLTSASETDFETTITQPPSKSGPSASWQNPEFFMSYNPTASNPTEEQAYSIHSGSVPGKVSFSEATRGATMDLVKHDDAKRAIESRGEGWDKRQKKYVSKANDYDGSKGVRVTRGESGRKIPASFRSGRFDAWKKSKKLTRIPKIGEQESKTAFSVGQKNPRFRYNSHSVPKEPDKFRDDYYKQRKKTEAAKAKTVRAFTNRPSRSKIKGIDEMRKERQAKLKRREKRARL